MTRNRDHMSLTDMVRVCAVSFGAIVGGMLLLGAMMIAHKPELGLELATSPAAAEPVPVAVPLPVEEPVETLETASL